jgi:hypothetical protein
MKKKLRNRYLTFIVLLILLLVSCSSEITFKPTPTISVNLQTPTPSQPATVPATLTHVVHWEDLPLLSQLILTKEDICLISTVCYDAQDRLPAVDITNELGESCLLDCTKSKYQTREWEITITLIRANDKGTAYSIVQDFRNSYRKNVIHEFDNNDIKDMPSEALAIASRQKDSYMLDSTISIPLGTVVILVHLSEIFCTDSPDDGFICEGDTWWSSYIGVQILNSQAEKLIANGYPN